ncbi:hypothetical protein GCK72_021355 [Caenorhabditis remanei]|uniref:Uncharacterized protein n=1 Tax=Caenorhabditis remanei TaxID=31234 RepID=A0A6A5GJM1_CAERE|nr:hypothetical protein GCK72_021355 [Caenorhabditis remanei]KAF1754791.1 hypothetical protein GCK72_021355 [Caenorhabditis remanei]
MLTKALISQTGVSRHEAIEPELDGGQRQDDVLLLAEHIGLRRLETLVDRLVCLFGSLASFVLAQNHDTARVFARERVFRHSGI